MSKALYDVIGGKSRKVGKVYGVAPAAVGMSKNLLPVYDIEVITTNGVTYQDGVQCERNEDGSIHVYGTAIEVDNKFYVVHPSQLCKFPSGTYTMSLSADLPGSMRMSFEYYSSDGKSWLGNYGAINASNPTRTVEINEEHSLSLYIFVPVGMTVDITLYPQLELGSEATDYVPYGELIQSLTRKIKKSYDVVGGRTKQFYSAEFMSYTGEYEVLQVEYESKICDLYRLKKSGILTLNDDALFWMCGGGCNGGNGSRSSSVVMGGDGGAGGNILSGEIAAGNDWTVTVGAAGGGKSSITDGATTHETAAHSSTKNGASGGGDGGYVSLVTGSSAGSGGAGNGVSTIPFGIASLGRHSAGGAGGTAWNRYYDEDYNYGTYLMRWSKGGAGGTNGGAGGSSVTQSDRTVDVENAPAGGNKGGGNSSAVKYTGYGTEFTITEPTAATFYGSGGAGGCALDDEYNNIQYGGTNHRYLTKNGTAGYQGVVYILDVNGGVPA